MDKSLGDLEVASFKSNKHRSCGWTLRRRQSSGRSSDDLGEAERSWLLDWPKLKSAEEMIEHAMMIQWATQNDPQMGYNMDPVRYSKIQSSFPRSNFYVDLFFLRLDYTF